MVLLQDTTLRFLGWPRCAGHVQKAVRRHKVYMYLKGHRIVGGSGSIGTECDT